MSNEQLAIACPKQGCSGLLHTSWQRGKRSYSPCTSCQAQFRYCVRGENCSNPSGPVQEEDAFYTNGNGGNGRKPACKTCERSKRHAK